MQIFARLTKVDEATRRVYGRASQEVPDRSGEIFDYESSVPHFKSWSSDIEKVTDGKSVGNVRAMHGKVAAGKLTEITFLDAEKAIDVCAEIVDDNEWKKCAAGVYTGFSVGGKYGKKWTDPDNAALKRYEAIPAEVSLVDLPCVPTANFTMVKADGATVELPLVGDPEATAVDEIAKLFDAGTVKPTELVKLLQVEQSKREELAKAEKAEALKTALANEAITIGEVEKLFADNITETAPEGAARLPFMLAALHKFAGLEKREFTQEERDKAAKEGDALPDGSFPIKTKEDLANAVKAYGRAKDPEKAKAHIIARAKDLGAEADLPEDWNVKAAADSLGKGMFNIAILAQLLDQLLALQDSTEFEAADEGDNSPMPARLKAVCSEVGQILCEMAEEETAEADADKMAKIGKVRELLKVGARHSAADMDRLQGIHDHAVSMGAKCEPSEKAVNVSLSKALGMETDTPEAITKAVALLRAKAKSWDDAPAQPKGVVRVVEKAADTGMQIDNKEQARDEELTRAAESGDPLALMKAVHKYGGHHGPPGLKR